MVKTQYGRLKVKELLKKIGFTNTQASVLTILISGATLENVEYLLIKVEEEEIEKLFNDLHLQIEKQLF